nr:hypothetical protein [uncultured archaeon]AQS34297.1 hypothetical protein [uncultured archaeon]
MITYNDLYEILRKEKYSETLQPLQQNFIQEFSEYINDKTASQKPNDPFSQDAKSKKQLENAVSLFKELMLRRKKKILSLVFVATETGIMKRDYENLLPIEKETFDSLAKTFEHGEKKLAKMLNSQPHEEARKNKMILFVEDTEQFVNHEGKTIGPFKSGDLANLNTDVAQILVQGEKATFVDEN